MNYGKAIRIIRAARDMSQRQLADKADLDGNYISLVELGKRKPSDDALRAISKALNVPHYLFMLLASEGEDLRAISPDQASLLGRELLNILLAAETETEVAP